MWLWPPSGRIRSPFCLAKELGSRTSLLPKDEFDHCGQRQWNAHKSIVTCTKSKIPRSHVLPWESGWGRVRKRAESAKIQFYGVSRVLSNYEGIHFGQGYKPPKKL